MSKFYRFGKSIIEVTQDDELVERLSRLPSESIGMVRSFWPLPPQYREEAAQRFLT